MTYIQTPAGPHRKIIFSQSAGPVSLAARSLDDARRFASVEHALNWIGKCAGHGVDVAGWRIISIAAGKCT